MEQFLEFFSFRDPNVIYVTIGCMLLAASSSIVGCFTFLRKKSLIGDAIAHSVLPGICLAFLLFETKNPLILLGGATITGWLSVILIDHITSQSRIKADAAIGLVLSVFFGAGILLLTYIQHTGMASQSGLQSYLFGKAAAMTRDDIYVLIGLSILIIVVMLLFYKEFALMTFDEDHAQAIGLPVKFLEIMLSIITVLAVAVGIQAVGVVLMAAMLIAPATAGRYWTDKLGIMLFLAAIFGAFSGLIGAFISYTAPSMSTGPWIIITISFVALFSILFAPNKGYVSRTLKQKRNQQHIINEDLLKLFYKLEEKRQTNVYQIPDLLERRYFIEKDMIHGLNRLTRKGNLKKSKEGWSLTKKGFLKAMRLVRLHRLWEVYLSQHLNMKSDHVHEDAEAIEHIITPELEAELQQFLDKPELDPHGSPIPYEEENG